MDIGRMGEKFLKSNCWDRESKLYISTAEVDSWQR